MVHHQVWFKLKEGVTSEEKAQLEAGLKGMIPQIPQIIELVCGEDFVNRSRGYDFGLYVKVATKEDNEIYAKHPKHLEFIANCKHLWTDVVALDFEG